MFGLFTIHILHIKTTLCVSSTRYGHCSNCFFHMCVYSLNCYLNTQRGSRTIPLCRNILIPFGKSSTLNMLFTESQKLQHKLKIQTHSIVSALLARLHKLSTRVLSHIVLAHRVFTYITVIT